MNFDQARAVADAVLYEGYVLYPYRASSKKNQIRWQFGVVVPPAYAAGGTGESASQQTECVIEPRKGCELHLAVRFLHAQARTVTDHDGALLDSLQVGDQTIVAWDEAFEEEVSAVVAVADVLTTPKRMDFVLPSTHEVEQVATGRVVRERAALAGALLLSAQQLPGPWGAVQLKVVLENTSGWDDLAAGRDAAMRRSLLSAHTLMGLRSGTFLSMIDPPEWAKPAVADCQNLRTFPVLIGAQGATEVMLSSPIILYDYPQIAPESPRNLYDGTEIDEILTLRTMALTDAEKAEARATDPRAAAVIDHVDHLPPALLEKLHGTIRYLRGAPAGTTMTSHAPSVGSTPSGVPVLPTAEADPPWWDPGQDASVSPTTAVVYVSGTPVGAGSRVRLEPSGKGADAQDMFLQGRTALVQAVLKSVDDDDFLAVSLEDDPGADLQAWHGRYLYFSPHEVQPLAAAAETTP